MAGFQTAWPGFPSAMPYEAPVPRPSHVAGAPAGLLVPCFYSRVTEKPSPKENRKFFLDRSVFDLVDAHPYLALTDPNLLGWYLCLSPEDRRIIQDEGGLHQFLQRHPALELSRHHVYVKYNIGSASPVQPPTTSHKQITSGAKSSRCGMLDAHPQFDLLPNNVRETLTLLGCSNKSQKDPGGTEQLVHLQDSFKTAFSWPGAQEASNQRGSSLYQLNEDRPSWQMASSSSSSASFSLDAELQGRRRWRKSELRSQISVTQGQSANVTYAEVTPLQSVWSTAEKDSPSEYYSFDSVQMDGTGFDKRSSIQSAEREQVSSPLGPAEENITKEEWDYMVCGNEHIADFHGISSSFEDQIENLHSVMEGDKSILTCVAGEDAKAVASSCETVKSDQSVIKMDTAERCTSPEPGVTTCDVMVGTERAPCTSASTQTEAPETSDKHVITEVHMADLDYLAEEFIKLKMVKEELRKQNEKMKSLGGKMRQECDCVQRAQQAELSFLALQYSMCRQHCWRLYYTSAEGGQLAPMLKNPPANIVSVEQKLESDYNQMREKILAGVPLEQLQPLSVESERIIAGGNYVPAQIIGDVLENVSCTKQPLKHDSSGEDSVCPDNQSRHGCQHSQRKEKHVKKDNSQARRAVALIQDRDVFGNAHKPEEKQPTAACRELNTSEAWYDAEEELESAGPAVAAETTVMATDKATESANDEAKSSLLSVSNLQGDVTESDVMLWFEKYQASEVSMAALKDDLRVAMVMTSGPQSAEAAARELNGCSVQGHTLHVEHISGGGRSQTSASITESSPESDSCSAERKLIPQPPLGSSIRNRKVVCISPTAKGGFDALMAELMQHHPDAGRQRVVEALMELRSRHRGALSSLPLRTIRAMTSEILSRPASATQL